MFWSRQIFKLLSEPILKIDAALVGWATGMPRSGNALRFADGSGSFWIGPGCSSLANVSLAVLCWVLLANMFNVGNSLRGLGWCLLAMLVVVTINVTRISLIGLHPEYYDLLHSPAGLSSIGALTLCAMFLICYTGARHEAPDRL